MEREYIHSHDELKGEPRKARKQDNPKKGIDRLGSNNEELKDCDCDCDCDYDYGCDEQAEYDETAEKYPCGKLYFACPNNVGCEYGVKCPYNPEKWYIAWNKSFCTTGTLIF